VSYTLNVFYILQGWIFYGKYSYLHRSLPPDMQGDDVCNKFFHRMDGPQTEEGLDPSRSNIGWIDGIIPLAKLKRCMISGD
jgi:hypothetical protein